ncbi:hypothetical protein BKA57DRAFT_451738 [Linnemannia elongata]|uniref:Superoxide dismutase copper/zinc binding domain-containing protein n=1 Tax=Linnemannia elongata AG-77 TaxID=1314771 RepID=A0A197JVA9_9FUNG|nr:hypothetical protein BKA57DRAFT_451738 [Linnemannia elongata]OAQ28229.1 hypothetical protein K457DRAFT_138896 [Linnemannia elongata AG-77]
MLFKSAATLLAFAGLVAAQGTPSTELKHGYANVTNLNGDMVINFTFDKVEGGMNITLTGIKGLSTSVAIDKAAGFQYHVHVKPVGPNYGCMATEGHLNPFNGSLPCNKANLTACEIGDLAGKHGNIVPTEDGTFPTISYIDTQLSFTEPANGALVGRSIVIHNNGTRVACGNLVVDGYTAPAANGTSTGAATNPTATGKNSAAKLVGSAALTGVVALFMMAL